MRRPLVLLALLSLSLASAASAQDASEDAADAPDPAADELADEADGPYEPDQRGDVDDVVDVDGEPDDLYEPDQRGDLEDDEDAGDEPEPMAEPGTVQLASESAAFDGARLVRFYLDVHTGYSFLSPAQLAEDAFLPAGYRDDDGDRPFRLRRSGAVFGLGAGVAVHRVSVGLRGRLAIHDGGVTLGTVGAEVGVRLPASDRIAPWVRLGFGAAFLGGLAHEGIDPSISGFYAGLGLGVLGRVGDRLLLGGGVDADVLLLARDPVDDCAGACRRGDVDFAEEGDAVGLSLGFHLDLRVEL